MSRLAAAVLLGAFAALPASLRAQTPGPAAAPAPAPAPRAMEHHAGSGWAEFDAYHTVMAAAWHPAAGKNDLAPARARVAELAQRADAWGKTAPPASASAACRTAATPTALVAYTTQVRGLASRAAGLTDAALKSALRDVHEGFHVFERACGGEAGHEGEHQH